jgi:acetoin utilization deacetylase AcuC-like enzyme
LFSDFQVSPLSTFEELSTTHDPTYIQRFLEGDQTEKEQRNVGFPWSNEGVDRALSSVGGTLAAACFVCEHERQKRLESTKKSYIESFSPTWAAHIAGGTHHAFYDYGEGFSVFSDMGVAANVVLDKYPDIITNKILMIDLDVHQGNGNAVLFQPQQDHSNQGSSSQEKEDETTTNSDSVKKKNKYADRVFTFSMHCSGNYFSEKQESDLDIELPIGCKDKAYLMTLNHWLKRFRAEHHKAGDKSGPRTQQHQPESNQKYRWDLVIFQAGVDVLDDDRLGRMALSPGAVARRNELVYEFAFDLGVPLVICMGGGYPKSDNAWESITEAHSDVYIGAHNFLSRLSVSKNRGISESHSV